MELMPEETRPRDVSSLERAVNDASSRASVLWLSFVTFALYLGIAAGSVTHRMLFLETPVKLPVLNVELALVSFFVVAPVLFLIFHFYLFVQLRILAQKIDAYDDSLRRELPIRTDRIF